jgi:hypothetical protein
VLWVIGVGGMGRPAAYVTELGAQEALFMTNWWTALALCTGVCSSGASSRPAVT